MNSPHGLPPSRFCRPPFVYTIHHHPEQALNKLYSYHLHDHFVTISNFQRRLERTPSLEVIHYGIDFSLYLLREKKQRYFSFLGRIAQFKGIHLVIEVTRNCGISFKIAGEVQPMSQEYFDTQVKSHLDGKPIQYVGEVDLQTKNELLGNSLALLFPIGWDEPFGLIMVEAMAGGTPVLSLPGGTAAETISDGVSGYVCQLLDEMADYARGGQTLIRPSAVRRYVEQHFAAEHMASKYVQLCSQIYENASAKRGKGTQGSGGLTTTA